MLQRFIYTLYLFSRFRKLEDHNLIAGGFTLLLFQLYLIALLKMLCKLLDASFIDIFFDNRLIYIFLVVILFFLSKGYASLLIKRIKAKGLRIKKIALQKVWLFIAFSIFFFLIVMIFF